jgi:hypothetical protein
VTISEFFVFDARTGVALLRFHPDDPSDAGIQTQARRKAYPLELQVSGSGVVYVQVDGGSEENYAAIAPTPWTRLDDARLFIFTRLAWK